LWQNTAPGNRETIRIHAEPSHDVDVCLEVVVGIASYVAGIAIGNIARFVSECVPGGRAFAIFIPATFNLIGSSSRTEVKVWGKLGIGCHGGVWP